MEVDEVCDEGHKEYILNKWQRCLFRLNAADAKPSERADAVRGILSQLHTASVCNNYDYDFTSQLILQYASLHSSIVDCSNPETGLNNYATGALALSASHPNESSEWKTSLTKDTVMNLPFMKDILCESNNCNRQREERLDEAAKNFLHATKQPPRNFSNQQPKTNMPSISALPSNNIGNNSTRPQINSTNEIPSGHPSQRGNISMSMPKQNIHSATSNSPTLVAPPSVPREMPQPQNRTLYQSSGKAQGPPWPGNTHQPNPHAGQQKKPYVPPGGGRAPVGGGAMGYDPASQMCNLGILGMNDQGASSGQPSLKRKFGSSGETGRQGNLNFRPGPPQGFQGNGTGPGSGTGPGRSLYNRGPRPRPEEEEEGNDGGGGNQPGAGGPFRSAREQMNINNQKKFGNRGGAASSSGYGGGRKVLGVTRRGPNSKFIPPVMNKDDGDSGHMGGYKPPTHGGGGGGGSGSYGSNAGGSNPEEPVDERLKNIDPKMIELVMNEIMDHGPPINWDDIAGLEFAKTTIKEIVVWPMLRPDIFTGLRGPPKGLLLFGPPGTGKTLIGKCIACQSGATFFSISASSLTSKWVGEGEKMVRALFAVARCYQPAVIFIDEIDSLLSQRSNDEHESSRRIKTEFLVQLDGATTSSDERLLIVGATNRPQEIDEAARRRLVKRLYIPLPDPNARKQIVCRLLSEQSHSLSDEELENICQKTDGYSGADMANLCREAALGPIRSIQGMDIQHISAEQVRPILHGDFMDAVQNVRPSVAQSDLDIYLDWNSKFGCGTAK